MNPSSIEYNGRNFEEDLAWFTAYIIERRMQGQEAYDENWKRIQFFPHVVEMNMELDKLERRPAFQTPAEIHAHFAKRDLWVQMLWSELRKKFL